MQGHFKDRDKSWSITSQVEFKDTTSTGIYVVAQNNKMYQKFETRGVVSKLFHVTDIFS